MKRADRDRAQSKSANRRRRAGQVMLCRHLRHSTEGHDGQKHRAEAQPLLHRAVAAPQRPLNKALAVSPEVRCRRRGETRQRVLRLLRQFLRHGGRIHQIVRFLRKDRPGKQKQQEQHDSDSFHANLPSSSVSYRSPPPAAAAQHKLQVFRRRARSAVRPHSPPHPYRRPRRAASQCQCRRF